ncbi:MAG: hypothetical protein J1G04_06125 [Clostridiales bacterium]|nr:hypothetical protein [Clostridiales bacterium]
MYELKYKITQADVKSVNKSIMWAYFIPYLAAALVGIGVGIAATVLRPRTEMLVMGIILIVLGVILLACAILLLIAPKNFVASALLPSDDIDRTVKFSDDNITVSTEDKADIIIDYFELNKIKCKNTCIVAYLGKEQILIIKDAFTSAGNLQELFEFIKGRMTKIVPSAPAQNTAVAENAEEAKSEDADVLSDNEKTKVEDDEPTADNVENAEEAVAENDKSDEEQVVETDKESEKPAAKKPTRTKSRSPKTGESTAE